MNIHSTADVDAYIAAHELEKVVDFSINNTYQPKPSDTISGSLTIPFPPEKKDLVRLHSLIRTRKPFTVLEFGVGYSTAIIADALYKNKLEWEAKPSRPSIRNRFMFNLFSVDSSKKWIQHTKKQLPKHLQQLVTFHYSKVTIGTYRDQLCHYYDTLPNIVPDFIYLDAPDAKDVAGSYHGLSFACDERTVLAGDILLMESTFVPGAFILIDGRTNNARFLARNLQRKYKVVWDRESDITTLELDEDRLGPHNVWENDFF